MRDLELKKHGLKVYLRDPSSHTPLRQEAWKKLPNGQIAKSLTLGMNQEENKRQIGQFSAKDAESWGKYEAQLERFVHAIDPILDSSPPEMSRGIFSGKFLRSAKDLATSGLRLGKEDIGAFYELMTAPALKVLNNWFESEPLKATLATDACIGAMISPKTPGSGYVLLHHVMGELEGIKNVWGYPEGGMGAVSNAIARSAISAGAEVVTDCPVDKILTNDLGVAEGVRLASGGVIKAKSVLSNLPPNLTFLEMMDPAQLPPKYRESVQNVDYKSPVTKINVAVNKLPDFLASPNQKADQVMPHHRATIHLNCENSEQLEEAYNDAAYGNVASKKPMVEMTIPSSLDPTLAPPGQHVCLFFTQYTPYDVEGGWTPEATERYVDKVFDTVEEYAPGFKASVVGKDVLTPPALEKTFGLTRGNIFHGAMSLDQLYLTRPVADQEYDSPGTPVRGLYLCGSGSHPGGGVMGSPGRLAAIKVVNDTRQFKWKFSQ